ncbi:MAG: adenylyl-sulfate kinase [Verrucomicrobiota bacterium]
MNILKQKAKVIWFYGLSGAGKSALASELQKKLYEKDFLTVLLDGDVLREGLNRDLGFSDEARAENIRRAAEVARLFFQAGVIVIGAFITPFESLRKMAREIIGEENFLGIYVQCSYAECAKRDVKGLYAKVKAGEMKQFTGRDSAFEEPPDGAFIVNTENESLEKIVERIYAYIQPHILP